ncbi:MAG: hypothetical protein C0631_03635 [Sedimenticola sp.]|jgi:septal ring factor EnvC (AmiA/AmiB activator)|nr:MAG: hypothetical protein C0631_03635 [Sedimenticola sp.]
MPFRYTAWLALALCQTALAQAPESEISQIELKKQQLEKEAAEIRAEMDADKQRLEKLQQMIDEWREKNAAMDSQLNLELKAPE